MNRPVLLLIGCLLVLFTCVHAPAEEVPLLGERLSAEGGASQYWVARTTNAGQNRLTSISKRVDPVVGQWAEVARFQSDITSCAPVGNRLAVLLPSGEWRMLEDSPGPLGPPLPPGYHAIRFAGDGDALLAVAAGGSVETQPTTHPTTRAAPAAVLRFADNTWSVITDLPHGLVPDEADVIRVAGTLYAAGRRGASIDVWAYRGEAWEKVWSVSGLSVRQFGLLRGQARPMLATMTVTGSWTLRLLGDETPVLEASEPRLPSDVAIVGPTLRIVYVDGNEIRQLAYDDYGAGAAYPLTTIARTPVNPQAMNSWVNVIALVLLTVTMLLTFRQRPATPGDMLASAQYRVSPLGRRFAAGFLDAVPMLVGAIYSLDVMQREHFANVQAINVPTLIGTAVYILHVGISELIWGKSMGKALFGLRVVMFDGTRAPADRIVLRNLLRVVDMFFFAPLLMIVLTPMRQRVGDLAAKTIVVYEADPEEEPDEVE